MEAGKRTIEAIFNKGRTLEIPFFQRSYVWTEENWERFLSNMAEVSNEKKDYFMGALILKSKPVSSGAGIGDWRIVVDGQQRLTTIILFFKAYSFITGNDSLFNGTFFNRQNEIILKHNYNDIEIFEAITKNSLNEDLIDTYKNNNILKCFDYFKNCKDDIKSINIDNLLDNLYFVGIDLGNDEDEQQIFDTINSLGVRLTTAELLKNEIFRQSDVKLYESTWRQAFESDEDTKDFWDQKVTSGRQYRNNIDFLLQAYLLIISGAHTKYSGLEHLFSNYKDFLQNGNKNKEDFVNKLISFANIYKDYIDPDFLNEDINKDSYIERLNIVAFGLNITTILPYILYILEEVSDAQEKKRIFKLIETYLIRRLICKATTKNYNNLFASLVRNKINTYKGLYETIDTNDDPTNYMPDDNDLQKGFTDSNLTNQQASVILYLLELSKRDKKHTTKLRPFNEYSLEHIMPKNWRKKWNQNLSDEQARQRDKLLLKIGNLTLLTASLNCSVKDAAWKDKINGIGDKGGLKKYASGISIFENYLEVPNWDENAINQRNTELFNLAKDVWTIDK